MNVDHLLAKARELISYFETANVRDFVLNLDQKSFIILAGVGGIVVVLLLLKGMVRWATFVVALCSIIVLLHFTIPEKGQSMDLQDLATLFLLGTFIVAATIYVIFIRTD